MLKNVFENYERQNIEDKELIIISNKDDLEFEAWESRVSNYKSVQIYRLPKCLTLGVCLNYGIYKVKYDDYYSEDYLNHLFLFLNIFIL